MTTCYSLVSRDKEAFQWDDFSQDLFSSFCSVKQKAFERVYDVIKEARDAEWLDDSLREQCEGAFESISTWDGTDVLSFEISGVLYRIAPAEIQH